MSDKPGVPINLYCLTVLTLVKDHPGVRKSVLYTSSVEKKYVDYMLQRDLISMDHQTNKDTAVTITETGLNFLDHMWGLIDMWVDIEQPILDRIESKIALNFKRFEERKAASTEHVYASRGVIVPVNKKKNGSRKKGTPPSFSTKGLRMNDLVENEYDLDLALKAKEERERQKMETESKKKDEV